jgi:hypothetical protein
MRPHGASNLPPTAPTRHRATHAGYAAIGHVHPAGGGARNVFGQQFWDEWGE